MGIGFFLKLFYRYGVVQLVTGVLLFSSSSVAIPDNTCHTFYYGQNALTSSALNQKVSDVLRDVPVIRDYIMEMIEDPLVPSAIKRLIKKAIQDNDVEVRNLNDQLRLAWNVPDDNRGFATSSGSNYPVLAPREDTQLSNSEQTKSIRTDFKNEHSPGSFGIALLDQIRPNQNNVVALIHELAHVRFEAFLRAHWRQVFNRIPEPYVAETPSGYWAAMPEFIDLLHEKYAFESQYRVMRALKNGRFPEWSEEWDSTNNRSPKEITAIIGEMYSDRYGFTDPDLKFLSRQPLSRILLGGPVVKEAGDAMMEFREFSNMKPSAEEFDLYLVYKSIVGMSETRKNSSDISIDEFSNLLEKVLILPDGIERANNMLKFVAQGAIYQDSLSGGSRKYNNLKKFIHSPAVRSHLIKMGKITFKEEPLDWKKIIGE